MLRRESTLVGLILVVLDIVGLYASVAVFQAMRLGQWGRDVNLPLALVILSTILVFYILNLYAIDRESRTTSTFARVFLAMLLGSMITASLIYFTRSFELDPVLWRSVFLFAMLSFFAWASLIRYFAIRILRSNRRQHWYVIGELAEFESLQENLAGLGSSVLLDHVTEAEFLENFSPNDAPPPGAGLGGLVVTRDQTLDRELVAVLMQHRLSGCRVLSSEEFYEAFGAKIPVSFLQDNWFVLSEGFDLLHRTIDLRLKRIVDVAISFCVLSLGLPLMLIATIAIKAADGGRVFYRQRRTGKDGRVFTIIKFRTMVENAESGSAKWADRNDPRITVPGKWLRRTRIDELPQLWNVLKGEMSFVGPRPERPEFNALLEAEIPYYDLRHLVKPGLTGWAQVMYPYGASVEDSLRKLEYDLYYIKNYSFVLDIFIILRTVKVVLSHQGR